MSQIRASRLPALSIALAMGLAACGGSPTQAPATPGATSGPAATTGPGGPAATAAPTTGTNPGGPSNTAVVTIGAERYEFTGVRCDILTPGYIQAGNYGGDPEVIIVLPPDGWEAQGDVFSPPQVQVTIGSGSEEQVWFAGDEPEVFASIPDGSSQLTYSVPEGRPVTATGTGTFIDLVAINFGREWSPVSGSFEVSCP